MAERVYATARLERYEKSSHRWIALLSIGVSWVLATGVFLSAFRYGHFFILYSTIVFLLTFNVVAFTIIYRINLRSLRRLRQAVEPHKCGWKLQSSQAFTLSRRYQVLFDF